MVNQKHLEFLKQGVNAWNKWRKENEDIEPDPSDTHPSKMNLPSVPMKVRH